MNRDLTTGKPETVLWQFCLPLFGSIIFQQLYNIADSLVAGKFIGENALAAVGNSYEITLIFIAFAFGCNIGCSVIVSTYFGAKRFNEMKTAVYTALIFSGALCLTLMLIGILGCNSLLELIRTPQEVFADSKLYLDIYVWGLPFVFYYNISTGIFSAMGDSRTPFYFLAVSSCANIAMDIWFVAGFHMGVAGVAWATFICQGISAFLALFVVMKKLRAIRTEERCRIFSSSICIKIAKIAIPSILQQSFVSVGNIILQGVINGNQAQQSGDHLLYDAGERYFQLHRSEPRSRKAVPYPAGFPGRHQNGLAFVPSYRHTLHHLRKVPAHALYEHPFAGCHAHRPHAAADRLPLLFCEIRKAGL